MKQHGDSVKVRPSSYAWLVVGMLSVVGCLNYLDRMMIATMRSSILSEIHMTEAQFGLLTYAFLWVYGFLSPIAGFIADKYSKSRIIVISLLVWSAITFLTAFATSFEYLLVTRALMGISEAFYIPTALALIMEYHQGPTRSFANSVHIVGITLGQCLGFIGGWLAEDYSWNFAFKALGAVGIVYAVFLIFSLKDNKQTSMRIENNKKNIDKPGFFSVAYSLLKSKNYLKVLFTWIVLGMVGWVISGWLPTFYKENFNLTQTMAGVYATGYFYIASIAGVLLGGYIADRLSKRNIYARIVVPMIGLCIASPAILFASYTSVLTLSVIGFMLYAFTRVFSDGNMMPIICLIVNDKHRATAYGILNFFATIIGGIGIYVGGYLRDANINLSTLFQIAGILMGFGALSLFLLQRYLNKREKISGNI